ncbi:ribosomal protein L17 [Tuber borchii]|uniref:Ribosomal protein L17 n=1 Tax=Tuber borchii TaxID=42251 RepID=A0A2T6ZHS2_TUBBO|nr:ribosomal protein L17 [Tuber borchii]
MTQSKAFRALSRSSAHRQALLRNLVTDLIKHESIFTTYAKAKEAQRIAEQVITLGKRGTNATLTRLKQILYVYISPPSTKRTHPEVLLTPNQVPEENVPRVVKVLAPRYKQRAGGYTRVQRIEPLRTDQAESAILELVDGPRDMRFALTAKAIAYAKKQEKELSDITLMNIKKVTQFRVNGEKELEAEVKKFEARM